MMRILHSLIASIVLLGFLSNACAQEDPNEHPEIRKLTKSYKDEINDLEKSHANAVEKLNEKLQEQIRQTRKRHVAEATAAIHQAMEEKNLGLAVAVDGLAKKWGSDIAEEKKNKKLRDLQKELQDNNWEIVWMDANPRVSEQLDFSEEYSKDTIDDQKVRRFSSRQIIYRPTLSFNSQVFVYDAATNSWLGFWASADKAKMRPMKLLKRN